MKPGAPLTCLARLIASVRWREVAVLQGTPLFGALFSIGSLTGGKIAALALMVAGSCCLVAHVFVLNDWAGVDGDLHDPHREASVFVHQGISRRAMGYLALALMIAALALLAALGAEPFALGAGVVTLSALYSAPGLHFKGVPVANSGLHIAGGVAHFLMGYALFSATDARGLAVAGFFALTFAAGHLTHEARDWEGDSLNAIRTNAVRFGRKACFLASFALFTLSYAWLTGLALAGVVPPAIAWIVLLYPLQLYWTLRTLRAGLSFETLGAMQARYRLYFLIIGAVIVVSLLPSLRP